MIEVNGEGPTVNGRGFGARVAVNEWPHGWAYAGERAHSPVTVDRSRRSGFALFTVLWLIVALSVVTTLSLGTARLGRWESANRIALRRGRWAADACLEILLGRYAGQRTAPLDSVDLGTGTWCRARVEDPDAKLNINTASDSVITAALGDDTLAAALLDWRDADDSVRVGGAEREWYLLMHRMPPRNGPYASVAELRLVRGFDSSTVARADNLFTVRGPGHVNVNDASPAILATLPGVTPSVLDVILTARADHRSFSDLDALVYAVPGSARSGLLAAYAQLRQQTVFAPEVLVAHLEGHAPESPAVARIDVTLVPAGARLAVVRREVW